MIHRNTNILLLSFTGIKSSGTILGSHEWHFEKSENFASTFWKKPTFTLSFELFIPFFVWLTKLPKLKIGLVIFCTMFSVFQDENEIIIKKNKNNLRNIFVFRNFCQPKRKTGWKAHWSVCSKSGSGFVLCPKITVRIFFLFNLP